MGFDQIIDRTNTGSLKWDKYKDTDILPLWVADMDFPVANEIQQALMQRLEHPVYGYTVATDQTASVVATKLQKDYNWTIEKEWIVWLPGVVAGLWAACKAVAAPGQSAMFNTPIYHHFFSVPGQAGLEAQPVAMKRQDSGRWTYDFDAMSKAVTPETRVMLLCSPHNPTGTLFTQDELQQMRDFCRLHNLLMVSDEIHCDLILSAEKKHIPTATLPGQRQDQVITLMSSSKTYNLAGINCSFAIIADPQLRQQFRDACYTVLPMVPGLAYKALEAAFSKADGWLKGLLQQLRENHQFVVNEIDCIDGLEIAPMEATYLAWINIEALGLDDPIKWFEQYGVGLSPGEGFGDGRFVRLNFACPMATLKEALKRIRTAVAAIE